MKNIKKQIALATKYVLVTNQYGSDMFISDPEKTDIPVTDDIKEALEYSIGFDNEVDKLGYWGAATGYNLIVRNLLNINQPVKLETPQSGEEGLVYLVTNLNAETGRVIIECVNSGMTINPTELVSINDIVNI